jgi:hypothetical protein
MSRGSKNTLDWPVAKGYFSGHGELRVLEIVRFPLGIRFLIGIYTGLVSLQDVGEVGSVLTQVDHDTLRRLRKLTEVVEDDLNIGVGHSKFARIASTGATLTSAEAFVLAGQNLLISAEALDEAYRHRTSIAEIKDQRFYDFYGAICIFIAEGFLLTTPFNFRFAWKGTRYLNNKYLYWFRNFPKIHRLIMSEIHYAIRGIIPAALRAPDEAVTYLTSIAAQTIQLLREYEDIAFSELPDKIADIVKRYQAFVTTTYEVAIADVSVEDVIQRVVDFVTGHTGILSVPADQDISLSTAEFY